MRWLLAFLLAASPALAQQTKTYYAPDGSPVLKQTMVGDRLVNRKMDGTPLNYWRIEGNFLVHRTMGGSMIERTPNK